jgi:hypothetical protein
MILQDKKTQQTKGIPLDLRSFWLNRKREMKADFNCVSIGTIQDFSATEQTASISINYRAVLAGGTPLADGTAQDRIVEYPLLLRCPVFVLSGGDARLTMPIRQGDTCLVFFCDRDIDNWFMTGDTTSPPQTDRMHDINDAVALVGIRSLANTISDYDQLLASLEDLHGERLAQTGDIKDSIRTVDHSGWIMMKGDTIGKATGTYQGEQYRDLFTYLKAVSPNTGSEDFDGGGTVVIPDMRGRGRVCADNMGGSSAGVLTAPFTPNKDTMGGAIGEEAHKLTGRESGIQQHNHGMDLTNIGGVGYILPVGNNAGVLGTYNTKDTGHTDAIDKHNTVQPGRIFNTFIKI